MPSHLTPGSLMRFSSSCFSLHRPTLRSAVLRFSFLLWAGPMLGCSSVGHDQTNEQSDAQVRFPAIERHRALNDLTSDEVEDLCGWAHTVAPSRSKRCLDGSLIVRAGFTEHLCIDALGDLDATCSANVDDFADCVEASPCDPLEHEHACSAYEACQSAPAEP